MLTVGRRPGERILIGDDIVVQVTKIRGGSRVHLSVLAPPDMPVLREELVGCPNARVGPLNPIDTAPKDGTFILLVGDSGYVTTPYRTEVGRWSRDKRRWETYDGDCFTDSGPPASHWMPLPW